MSEALMQRSGADELLRLKSRYIMPCVYHFYRNPPKIVAAEGAHLIDDRGRRLLDGYAGVAVMSAGHGNPAIIEAAIDQLRRLQHTTTVYLTEPQLRLAEAISLITPGDLERSFFCASGSEATEGALLTAALHTRRPEVVAFTNGLHGRTRWAMNATGLPMWRTDPFPLAGVHHVPFGDAAALERIFLSRGDKIAAVIGEPVQGNGGIQVPAPAFWPRVRALCDAYGSLMILDEVQTGINRTGRWFACDHWSVVPDILATSKALGNGFPIAAFVTTDEIAASCTRPGASTFGGNPLCAAAALATLEFHREHDLGRRATERGRQLRAGMEAIARDEGARSLPPRGLGLMMGWPIVDDAGAPSAEGCDALLEALYDNGVLAGKTGPDRNVLTFMPPLTITEREVGVMLDALQTACSSVFSR